jgi:large subunit ribosomal protein L15
MPLIRRIPKRGFNNKRFKIVVVPVNLSDLNVFEAGSVVDLVALQQAGLTNGNFDSVKVLGRGELTQKLTVRANAFSETARVAIEKLGGTAEVVS